MVTIVASMKKSFRKAAERAFSDIPRPAIPGKKGEFAEAPIAEYVAMESAECFGQTTRLHRRNLLVGASIVFVLTVPSVSLSSGFVISTPDKSLLIGLLYWAAFYEFVSFCVYGRADFLLWRKKNMVELLRFHNHFGTTGYAAIQNVPNRFETLREHFSEQPVRLRDNFNKLLDDLTAFVSESKEFYEAGNQYSKRLQRTSQHADSATLMKLIVLDICIPFAFFFWVTARALPSVLHTLLGGGVLG